MEPCAVIGEAITIHKWQDGFEKFSGAAAV